MRSESGGNVGETEDGGGRLKVESPDGVWIFDLKLKGKALKENAWKEAALRRPCRGLRISCQL
jgi:hypothetical protein